MNRPPLHQELVERIERDLLDSYDEELELEVEDRDPSGFLEPLSPEALGLRLRAMWRA